MGEPQLIRTEAGEELVVLTRRDYDALLARVGDLQAEGRMTEHLLDDSDAMIARGEDVLLPETVWQQLEAGEQPVFVLRRHRGLTQAALAARCQITQGFLSAIENRRKTGDVSVLKRIAQTLAVPLDLIVS